MADRYGLEVKGLDALEKGLAALSQQLKSDVGNALRAEAEIEMTEAKRRTPVQTGALRSSGHVEGPEEGTMSLATFGNAASGGQGEFRAGPDRADISVRLVFGGPAAAYAVYVHENLEAIHPVGQAKFLESTLLESAPYLVARIAARMKR
jgi:hypothetical protein